jgi:phage gpG-like protein
MEVEMVADPSLAAIADALASARTRAVDLREYFGRIAQDLKGKTEHRFASEGDGRWAPLSAAYADWKAQHYPGKGILVRTGRLLAAATGRSSELHLAMSSSELRFAITTPYAVFQGARAILEVEPVDRQRWQQLLVRHFEHARDGAIAKVR